MYPRLQYVRRELRGSQNESPFQIKPLREGCRVGKVYGVVSGKGGVGKSMVTSQLAVSVRREGYNVAVLDADITGPSIPKAFGIHGRAMARGDAIVPVTTATGIQLMSVNLLLEHETDPVIWRGPVIGGVVQQFWGDTLWNDVDYMFVDMPPAPATWPSTCSRPCRWTASSSWRRRRTWCPWWCRRP